MDDGWKLVEVDLETVAVNGNGNGHHADIGLTVELVPANCLSRTGYGGATIGVGCIAS